MWRRVNEKSQEILEGCVSTSTCASQSDSLHHGIKLLEPNMLDIRTLSHTMSPYNVTTYCVMVETDINYTFMVFMMSQNELA